VSPGALHVELVGTNLPGRACGPGVEGELYRNVHVALKHRTVPTEWVPGDAKEARWSFDVILKGSPGDRDFGGPYVYNGKGERAIGLPWGEVDGDEFTVFRAAKVMLDFVDPALVEQAAEKDATLRATIDLTDECGHPRCARVHPPAIRWDVV
jgi:Family of unknown function (DUF5990)